MQSNPPRAMMSGNSRNQWKKRFSMGGRPGHGGRLRPAVSALGPIAAELGIGNESRVILRRLGNVELRDRDRGDLVQPEASLPCRESDEALFLGLDLGGRALGQRGKLVPLRQLPSSCCCIAGARRIWPDIRTVLAYSSLRRLRSEVLVVAGHRGEGFVGDALVQFLAPDKADDGVAAFDVVVQKVERLAGVVGFQPERDLAEFDGERVQVHAVDAGADHVADRGAKGRGRWLLLAGANDGELGGDAPRGGEQDVARAAGDIGDAQIEQRGFRVGGFEALGDQVVERVLDERLDQIVRGVVRTGRGAFIRPCSKANSTLVPWFK